MSYRHRNDPPPRLGAARPRPRFRDSALELAVLLVIGATTGVSLGVILSLIAWAVPFAAVFLGGYMAFALWSGATGAAFVLIVWALSE